MTRVYILSASSELAVQSDYGPGWEKAWTDPDGNRLLPFRNPPKGSATMTAEEARAYQAQFAPEPEPIEALEEAP